MARPFVVIDHSVGGVRERGCCSRDDHGQQGEAEAGEEGGQAADGHETGEVDGGGVDDDDVGGDLGGRGTVRVAVGDMLPEAVVGGRDIVLLNLLIHAGRIAILI